MTPTRHPSHAQTKPSWRNSLPFRVGLLQAIVAAVLLFVSLWIIFGAQGLERREQELDLNLSQGQLIMAKLQHLTAQLNTLSIAIADVAGNPYNDLSTIEHTLPGLLSLPKQQDLIASGGVWPEPEFPLGHENHSRSLFWVRNSLGELKINDGYNDERGYLEEEWYKPVRLFPAGRVYWSPAYVDPHTRESMVTAAAPIWKNHQFHGAATLDVSLSSLSDFTNQAGKDLRGYVLVLDQFNRILASPNRKNYQIDGSGPEAQTFSDINSLALEHSQFSALQALLQDADEQFISSARAHPLVTQEQMLSTSANRAADNRALYQAVLNNSVAGMLKAPKLLGSVDIKQDPVLGENALLSVYQMPETFWKVVTVTPKTSLQHEALLLAQRAGLYLLLAQLLALALMYVIQKKQFISPIARIAHALKSNNAAYLEIDAATRDDEVGVLAKAFVARTQQLEIAKASLDASNLALEQQLAVQREVQQDLLGYREHLSALLKSSPNLIYIKDTAGRYILVNDKFCETIGLDQHRVLGATDQQLFSTDLALSYADSDRRVMSQDAPLQVEDILPTRMGEQRFQFTKFAVRDEDDNLRGIGAIAFDIQNRKRQEDELQGQLRELESNLGQLQQLKLRQEGRIQQLEHSLAQEVYKNTQNGVQDEVWRTERRLLRTWERHWVDLILQEQDRLLALACQSREEELESIRCMLMAHSARLRLMDNLVGKHRNGHSAAPLQLLVDLKALFEPELEKQQMSLTVQGDARCTVEPEAWQLTIFFFHLLRQLSALESIKNTAPKLNIDVYREENTCVVRFDRQGVIAGPLAEELTLLSQWLEKQFDASLTLQPTLQAAVVLDCKLPLVRLDQ